jgi:hypothetical protein
MMMIDEMTDEDEDEDAGKGKRRTGNGSCIMRSIVG